MRARSPGHRRTRNGSDRVQPWARLWAERALVTTARPLGSRHPPGNSLMNRKLLAVALCALVFVAGCASTETAVEKRAYTLVLLKTGPQSGKLPPEENKRLFAGHFENMARLAQERKLVVAGPYGGERHDKALRGLFVLDTGERTVATTWAETDPPTQAGIFVLEYHDLR